MIAIVDYGAGNVSSVKKAFEHLGASVQVTSDPEVVRAAEKICVPGVGPFVRCAALNIGPRQSILEAVAAGRHFLGICVGMQWLFEGSTEAPDTPGAAMFSGSCSRFPATVKSPHVGWNRIESCGNSRLLRGVGDHAFVYYTHSYRAPVIQDTVAQTSYGVDFSAVVGRGNIFPEQFHPEKSGNTGAPLLENSLALY